MNQSDHDTWAQIFLSCLEGAATSTDDPETVVTKADDIAKKALECLKYEEQRVVEGK